MELRTFARLLRRGWAFIVACVVIGGGIGVLLTVVSQTTYQSTAKVFVASNASADNSSLAAGNSFTQDRTAAYVIFARSPTVTQSVIKKLGLKITPNELAQKINATVEDNKVVIDLAVTDGSPTQAALIANTTAAYFIKAVIDNEQTTTGSSPSASPTAATTSPSASASPTDTNSAPPEISDITNSVVKLTVVYPANVPSSPVSPKPVLNIALGVLIGLLVSLAVIILRDVLDNTMKSPADFEALGTPVLGTVPFDRRAARSPVAFRGDLHSARSEAYRAIRTNMQFVDVDNPPHLIAVTSAMPGEGKTTTAINLASALAEAGYRVCLIDADLRRPSVAKTLGLIGDVGFTSVLISDTAIEDVLQNAGRNLAVLTSGPVPPNPSELLITDHARAVIAEIASKVDYCVIDTPPLLPVTDGAELSTIADATLIIARARKTTQDQSKRAIEALAKVGQKPVGVILNMISGAGNAEYESGYYTYRPERGRDRRKVDEASSTPAIEAAESTPDDVENSTDASTDAAVPADDAEHAHSAR